MAGTKKFRKAVLTSLKLLQTLPSNSWPVDNESKLKVSDYESVTAPMERVYVNSLPKITIVLNPDGTIWQRGTLYLLSRALDYIPIQPETIDSIASDLVDFRNALLEEKLDYQVFPLNIMKRPTYAYCSILNERAKHKSGADVEKRRISSVRKMYKWLKMEDRSFRPEYPMWVDEIRQISYEDAEGNKVWKEVVTTDLIIKHTSGEDLDSIDDGGKLRPLCANDLDLLLRALSDDGNTEMLLICAIALTSGARIQTVLTLRVENICVHTHKPDRLIPTKCGSGRNVETKRNKPLTIFIPFWLHQHLSIYVTSKRYLDRLSRSGYSTDGTNYIFITQSGRPYYMSRSDPNYSINEQAINGGAVRVFVSRLKEKMLVDYGRSIDFKFHDLRATFGMNLFKDLMVQVDSGKRSLSSALNYLRKRMSHSSLVTTMRYFRYYEDEGMAYEVQTIFEKKIAAMMHGTAGEV